MIRILFPSTTDSDSEQKALEPACASHAGDETILVVEDNEDVRRIAQSFLASAGYTVLIAEDGEEALRVAQGQLVDLLLTDVVMPGMNGREVADRLRRTTSEMRVVFMSGYPGEAIVHHGVSDSAVQFIQKPFTREKLLRQVRDTLDGRP